MSIENGPTSEQSNEDLKSEETETMNGNQLLGNGLETITNPDRFREAMDKVSEAAFCNGLPGTRRRETEVAALGMTWPILSPKQSSRTAAVRIATVPVILFTSMTDEGFKDGYLMLGSRRNAPCRNTADSRVQRLYTQVTEKPWSHSI